MNEKIAVIDIGSNSTKKQVYEIRGKEIKTIDFQTRYNRLAEDLITSGIIKNEKIIELLNILQEFKNSAAQQGANKIYCFATWAVRYAKNKDAVVKTISEKVGIQIEILNEHAENFYSFLALNLLSSLKDKKKVSLNIGGGSVELAIGSNTIENTFTFNIGGVILKEKFFDISLPLESKIKRCVDYVWKVLEKQLQSLKFNEYPLVGIGGTFSTLFAILQTIKIDTIKLETNLLKLPEQSFSLFFNKVKKLNPEQIQKQFNIHQKRADIFLPALIIVKSIIDIMHFGEIYISNLSIRDGYLLSKINS